MKSLRHLLPILGLALLVAAPALQADEAATSSAKPERHREHQPSPERMKEMREKRMKQLTEKLTLTADQQAKINAIWDEAGKAAKALHEQGQELLDQGRETMKDTRAKVRGALTPEQQKIFDEMKPAKGERKRHEAGERTETK